MTAALLLASHRSSGYTAGPGEFLVGTLLLLTVWLYYRRQAQRQQAKSNHPANNVLKEDIK